MKRMRILTSTWVSFHQEKKSSSISKIEDHQRNLEDNNAFFFFISLDFISTIKFSRIEFLTMYKIS